VNSWRILHGDVRERLRDLPDGSVQTCVTSPPYWGLRDYGVAGQIGLEGTPEAFVAALVSVFREVRRVLADDGTVWLNLGDSYSSQGGPEPAQTKWQVDGASATQNAGQSRKVANGLKPKDLCGIPWRVAFALQADGWYLRSDIIWSKPNPMPESVTDRPTKAHEYIFLLSKSARYYYDAGAIGEPIKAESLERFASAHDGEADTTKHQVIGGTYSRPVKAILQGQQNNTHRNKRSVWHIATQPFPGAHFATFPEALIEPCILAGSRVGDTVLDPFNGSGTTGAVAIRHQRNYVGIELNEAYIELARKRIGAVAPLFAEEVA
jgi:DNA modification methylase